MKKAILLFALCALAGIFVYAGGPVISNSAGDKDEPFVEKIKQSTLVVVMLEENEDYLAKLTKKGKNDMASTYSASIKAYNDNMRAMVPQCLKISSNIIFKTLSEIAEMSVDERNGYSYLLYNVASTESNMVGGDRAETINFCVEKQKQLEGIIENYKDVIQFECLDPGYNGAAAYRKLDIYAPGNKKQQPSGGIQQNLIEIVPTQADAKICLTQLQQQFDNYVKNENATKEELKAEIAKAEQSLPACYDTIKQKTLLICKQDIDKGLMVDQIKICYPFSYKVVSKDEFDKVILDNDAKYCALLITPFIRMRTTYGGGPLAISKTTVKYLHSIIGLSNENTLYSEGTYTHSPMNMTTDQSVTSKDLQEITKNLQNPGK